MIGLPVADPAAPVDVATVRRVRRGRRNLADSANLPVIRREHDLPEAEKACPCCGTPRQPIGQDVTLSRSRDGPATLRRRGPGQSDER